MQWCPEQQIALHARETAAPADQSLLMVPCLVPIKTAKPLCDSFTLAAPSPCRIS